MGPVIGLVTVQDSRVHAIFVGLPELDRAGLERVDLPVRRDDAGIGGDSLFRYRDGFYAGGLISEWLTFVTGQRNCACTSGSR